MSRVIGYRFTSDVAMEVPTDAMQLFAATAGFQDFLVERVMRNARRPRPTPHLC
jgi:alkylation response protein AidB-like acyl-CoA dehydrogenase